MERKSPTVQRSFRLSRKTAQMLDEATARSGETRNALADRLLGQSLRTEDHPMIRFKLSGDGRRRAILAGTRLYVHQVIATLRGHDGDIDVTAEYFGLLPHQIQAALEYYADYQDEVDEDEESANRFADAEYARWEKRQAALANPGGP